MVLQPPIEAQGQAPQQPQQSALADKVNLLRADLSADLSRLNVQHEGQVAGLSEITDNVMSLETLSTDRATEVNNKIAELEAELQALRIEGRNPARAPAARIPKNVTGTKGFEKLKVYSGDSTQWPEWRFRITTWLVQENPSFESLMAKLDKCESEPLEPALGARMMF